MLESDSESVFESSRYLAIHCYMYKNINGTFMKYTCEFTSSVYLGLFWSGQRSQFDIHVRVSLHKGKENWTKKIIIGVPTVTRLAQYMYMYGALRGWRQTVTCNGLAISSMKRRDTPSGFKLHPLPFGIVHGTPHLHRFFVNFGMWARLVSPVDVVGSSGGVCGADDT